MKKIYFLLFLCFSIKIVFSQHSGCHSKAHIINKIDFLQNIKNINQNKTGFSDYFTVRIKCHILRKSDGSGGVNISEVYSSLNYLQNSYNPHNICFSLVGID